MSHELRTPLNAIVGSSEIIKYAYVGPIPTRYQTYGQDIHRSGQHLLAIINDVLDFSKIEAGRLELHDEEVVIVEVARACSVLVAALAHEKQVFIEFELADDVCIVADELRLKQIVLNLLSNAVKFTHTGGWVVVSAHRNARNETILAVADDGIGMAAHEIAVAVQPFRQVDAMLARRNEGTGLGLPLAKRLIELHGGKFDLRSTQGEGTIVRASFPAERTIRSRDRLERAAKIPAT